MKARPRKQGAVLNELEPQAQRAVDQVRAMGSKQISRLWDEAKTDMRQAILHEYHRDFPGPDARWSLAVARAKGTLLRIERDVNDILNRFHAESLHLAGTTFRRVYATAATRHAWVLDQITPPSYQIKVPMRRAMHESAVPVYTGSMANALWKDRWNLWVGSYQTALNANLRMNALNETDASAAADEVDQTKSGTPAYDLDAALDRIYNYQALQAYSDAMRDLSDANPDADITEIWQTRDNARVCDECDANKGLTPEEADNDIPAHPNCECYWRLVPASWADLLKSGDIDDQELARLLDARGEVPNSMILKDDDGNLVAHAIVSFERWSSAMPDVVGMTR